MLKRVIVRVMMTWSAVLAHHRLDVRNQAGSRRFLEFLRNHSAIDCEHMVSEEITLW